MSSRSIRFLFVGAFFLTVFVTYRHAVTPAPPPPPDPPPTLRTAAPMLDDYGITDGRYSVVNHTIKRNQTFGTILSRYGLSYAAIDDIVQAAAGVFDVRSLRAGKTLRIYQDHEATPTPSVRYLVYEQDAVNYIVFDLAAPIAVAAQARTVTVVQREVSGVIRGSLYETLSAAALPNAVSSLLAIELSEVFAWQIDFYRIQPGDGFKLIYEERSVNGRPVGIGAITAARFYHGSRDYFAFRYIEDGVPTYFDESGRSLRRTFLMAPVKYSRISSRYAPRRFHPVQRRWKPHLGTDYAAGYGTPIYATGDGKVLEATHKRNNGNYVKIRHNSTYTTGYLHMSRIAEGIRPGVMVQQGEVIGYVGSTGLARGNHVCYRFWKNGQQVDHLREDFPPSSPVRDLLSFSQVRDARMRDLQSWSPLLAAAPTVATAPAQTTVFDAGP